MILKMNKNLIIKHIKKSVLYKIVKSIYYFFYFKVIFYLNRIIFSKAKVSSNKIVVDNFAGRGFGDNPKYIIEALLKKRLDLDIVWEVSDMKIPMPPGIRKVKYGSLKAYRELMTAKVWIDNIKSSIKPDKRTSQFYLQTWHGGIGLKASEKQVERSLPRSYVIAAKRDANMTDLMLSDSNWTTAIYSKWFWYSGKIEKTGFPRNDILINPSKETIDGVYNFYNIPRGKKIILYAPTFRDKRNDLSIYQFDFSLIASACANQFIEEYVVLIRLHPNVVELAKQSNFYNFDNNIINASNYPDMQELIVASDVLITDYSSCMFDAMLANKKVFLLAKDYDEFITEDRHLLFDIKNDLPFSFSNSEDELIKHINLFNNTFYIKQIEKFKNKVDIIEDGHASERVADIICNEVDKDNL